MLSAMIGGNEGRGRFPEVGVLACPPGVVRSPNPPACRHYSSETVVEVGLWEKKPVKLSGCPEVRECTEEEIWSQDVVIQWTHKDEPPLRGLWFTSCKLIPVICLQLQPVCAVCLQSGAINVIVRGCSWLECLSSLSLPGFKWAPLGSVSQCFSFRNVNASLDLYQPLYTLPFFLFFFILLIFPGSNTNKPGSISERDVSSDLCQRRCLFKKWRKKKVHILCDVKTHKTQMQIKITGSRPPPAARGWSLTSYRCDVVWGRFMNLCQRVEDLFVFLTFFFFQLQYWYCCFL